MSGRGKRLWAPRLDFQAAYQETLQFLQRCNEHKLTSVAQPTLYQAYHLDSAWPTHGMQDISSVLKFGFDRDPVADQAKQAAARLLSIAVKAHFFLDAQAIVTHEPYLFVMPDLGQPGRLRYGLVYPLDSAGRSSTILVAEWDLNLASARQPRLAPVNRFPVVLPADPFKWLSLKKWRALRDEATGQAWFETGASKARRKLLDDVHAHKDASTFPYGTILDYNIDLKDDVKLTGAMWARGISKWFLPKGWDIEAVKEYLEGLAHASAQDRQQLRWWQPRPAPRRLPGAEDDD